MRKSTILINIEESTITNSTEVNYSCGPKGVPHNASTITIRGSICLVTAILQNGISITAIRQGTIKTFIFIEYIKRLLEICKRL